MWSSIVPCYLDVGCARWMHTKCKHKKKKRQRVNDEKNKWLRDAKLAWEKWDGYFVVCVYMRTLVHPLSMIAWLVFGLYLIWLIVCMWEIKKNKRASEKRKELDA